MGSFGDFRIGVQLVDMFGVDGLGWESRYLTLLGNWVVFVLVVGSGGIVGFSPI